MAIGQAMARLEISNDVPIVVNGNEISAWSWSCWRKQWKN